MAVKRTCQLSLTEALLPQSTLAGASRLDQVSTLLVWEGATMKRRMGLRFIRSVGLVKARAQIVLAAMAFNLRRWAALAPG